MLKGKTAIVTGASRGIGKAIVLKLAKLGANVVINYRNNEEKAEELLREIESYGTKAIKVKCDVSKFDETKLLIDKTLETFGSIDILVNNAGITRDNLLIRMKETDFDLVLDTNLKGTFNTIKHVSKIMLKQRSGSIINISSISGVIGNIGQVNYSASKAGVIGLTKSAARELAQRGVRVNAIAPGFIETDMTDKLPEDVKKKMLENTPLNRFGKPEEIADVVVFLASDMSSFVTGQIINVNGGMSM